MSKEINIGFLIHVAISTIIVSAATYVLLPEDLKHLTLVVSMAFFGVYYIMFSED